MKSPGGDAVKAPRGASSERPRWPNQPPLANVGFGVLEVETNPLTVNEHEPGID